MKTRKIETAFSEESMQNLMPLIKEAERIGGSLLLQIFRSGQAEGMILDQEEALDLNELFMAMLKKYSEGEVNDHE